MLESRLLRAAHSRNRRRYSHFEQLLSNRSAIAQQSLCMLIPSCPSNDHIMTRASTVIIWSLDGAFFAKLIPEPSSY